ncbi:hypothetical protein NDU88_001374 [Pleurodeles waltl]|uniref:Uncharacterized protein n=1 Tax=Pleurodeles waltl TaxID=8319 RepID=A0AAV7MKU3_PLEWA|nr:hypothetical protein NDU88_001374 [Pleurodeles waltl]
MTEKLLCAYTSSQATSTIERVATHRGRKRFRNGFGAPEEEEDTVEGEKSEDTRGAGKGEDNHRSDREALEETQQGADVGEGEKRTGDVTSTCTPRGHPGT